MRGNKWGLGGGAAGVLAMMAGSAGAQDVPATTTLPTVVITADSRLVPASGESISPIRIITRDELRERGITSLRQLADDLPESGVSLSDVSGNASFAPGASAWSLRGLGAQATLVLLNGRRVAPYGLANYAEVFTNVDALPIQAVERIEIIKTGAAALYGSDAVAGVINVVTRSDWEGLEFRATREQSLKSSRFDVTSLSIGGGGLVDLGRPTRVGISLGYELRDEVMWGDVIADAKPRYASLSTNFGALSSYGWPGNLVGAGMVGTCDASTGTPVGRYCYYDRTTLTQAVPGSERFHALFTTDTQLGEGRSVFSELTFSHTRTSYAAPSQPYGSGLSPLTWGDPETGAPRTFWYRGLPAGHPLNSLGVDDAQLRYRFLDGPNETIAQSDQYRALVGLRGDDGRRSWETAVGTTASRVRADYRGWWSYSGFHQVIGNDDPTQVDPDFFNRDYRIGQANSQVVLDTLFPRYGYRGVSRQDFVDGKVSWPVARTAAGSVDAVAGFDLRREQFLVDPDSHLRTGDIVANGLSASDGKRNVLALFGELGVPLAKQLQLQAAARLDKYQGVPMRFSPKLGLRFQATPDLMFRATAETGFRAPNLTENSQSTKFAYYQGVPDPRRCPQAQALVQDLAAQAATLPAGDPQKGELIARANGILQNECSASVASTMRHNASLKPETSQSYSVGFVLTPQRRWKFSLDRWFIERRNEITYRSLEEVLDGESTLPAGTVSRYGLSNDRSFTSTEQATYGVTQGALSGVTGWFENLAQTRTGGTDVTVQTDWRTPLGHLEVMLDAAYLDEIRSRSEAAGHWGDNLAGRAGYPRWKGSLALRLATSRFTHTLRGTARSGTSLQGDYYDTVYSPEGCAAQGYTEAQCRIGGYTRWDYAIEYRATRELRLAMQVRNVFEREVPVGIAAWRNGGGFVPPTDEDARGRTLRLALEWRPR